MDFLPIAFFVLGLVLILVEVFVPGFGVFGITGRCLAEDGGDCCRYGNHYPAGCESGEAKPQNGEI